MSIYLNKTLSEYPPREKKVLNSISEPVAVIVLTLFMPARAVLAQGKALLYVKSLLLCSNFWEFAIFSAGRVRLGKFIAKYGIPFTV